MYKEDIVTNKVRALALIEHGFLFYRDEKGTPRVADHVKVDQSWGMIEFFACSHPVPRTIAPISVKLLVGANAYACIEESGRKTDILLSPGKSAPASLREYASDQRDRAKRLIEMADLAERAALQLESQK